MPMELQPTALDIARHYAGDKEWPDLERAILRHMEYHMARAAEVERRKCAEIAETVQGDFERDTPGRTEGATRQGIAAAIRARSSDSN